MTRRRHKSVPTQLPPDAPPGILSIESDANDRVRDWELPTSAGRGRSRNLLISLGFLLIIALAGLAIWYLLKSMPSQPQLEMKIATDVLTAVPKEVDELPAPRIAQSPVEPNKIEAIGERTLSRLVAPEIESKWVLSEFPTTGDRVELDPTGIYAYARNFTDACIRPPEGMKLPIAVRGRGSSSVARSFVGDGEACATLFDEPLVEMKLPNGEFRAVQFGLQQGAPYVAVRRIKNPTVSLIEIKR